MAHDIAHNRRDILTKRELEILKLLCIGNSIAEIAGVLYISIRTVEWHKKNLIEKTNAKTPIALAFYAIENGIIAYPGSSCK
jgi:DNA-binding CsgD family transcriptional regulator